MSRMRDEPSVSGMRDESSVSERREDPVSERRDHDSDSSSEISSDESDDADFNPNESVTTVEQQTLTAQHIEEWMSVMSRDNVMLLSLTLHHVLVNVHGVKKVDAAQTIAEVTGKGEGSSSMTTLEHSQTVNKAITRDEAY